MRRPNLLIASFALLSGVPVCAQSDEFAAAELTRGGIVTSLSGSARAGAIYQAGSIAKYACSVLALRMVDAGELDLDTRLASILPDLELGEAGAVTMRQLLSNRSGLRDGLIPAVQADMGAVMRVSTTDRALVTFAGGDLAATPGAEYSYDLVNWIAVQAALERAGGQPVADLLKKRVLDPAGMQASFIFDGDPGDQAQPPVEEPRSAPPFLQCAGGLAAPPMDLIALLRFSHHGGLSERSRRELTTITTPEENYTLGGRFVQHEGRWIDWKTGSNGAYKSLVVYDPQTDTGLAAMTATDDWSTIEARREEWLSSLD